MLHALRFFVNVWPDFFPIATGFPSTFRPVIYSPATGFLSSHRRVSEYLSPDFCFRAPGFITLPEVLPTCRRSAGANGQLNLEAGPGRVVVESMGAVGGMNTASGGLDDGAGNGQPQPAVGGRPVAGAA